MTLLSGDTYREGDFRELADGEVKVTFYEHSAGRAFSDSGVFFSVKRAVAAIKRANVEDGFSVTFDKGASVGLSAAEGKNISVKALLSFIKEEESWWKHWRERRG